MLDFGQGKVTPMTEETTAQFLHRRRNSLVAQIAALKGQIGPKEAELAQIDQMLGLLPEPATTQLAAYLETVYPSQENADLAASVDRAKAAMVEYITPIGQAAEVARVAILNALHPPDNPIDRYSRMTIKELVIQALIDHFPEGARTQQIRTFIKEGYGREIEQSSLRPQLHRLKADHILYFRPENEVWNIDPRKRGLYSIYNHPTSRAAMKELQDEPTGGAATIAAGALRKSDDFLD